MATSKRLAELAAAGLHDEQIADQLNTEGFQTGADKPWTTWAVRWARRKEQIKKTAPDLPRRHPLPDRHPDGRYSIAGTAKLFDVSDEVVRRWIKQGIVSADRESYGTHKNVCWLTIHPDQKGVLNSRAAKSRKRSAALKRGRAKQ